MTPEQIHQYIMDTCAEVRSRPGPTEIGFFYNPGGRFKYGTHVANLKLRDGKGDRASRLDREGFFRLDIGVPREIFVERFGPLPETPPAGGVVRGAWDFTATDTLMPHPSYGWDGWMSIVNPSAGKFEAECVSLIKLAHGKAVRLFNKRAGKNVSG